MWLRRSGTHWRTVLLRKVVVVLSLSLSVWIGILMRLLEPTLPALSRLRKYMRAAGRYGPSPFLVGHYGGTGEIAQGFCRAAAVSGAIYILGRHILSISGCPPPAPDCDESTWSKVDV